MTPGSKSPQVPAVRIPEDCHLINEVIAPVTTPVPSPRVNEVLGTKEDGVEV